MPSSATITAFYTFAANTKARASEVNANFELFRGHLIPINTLTQTASDVTHDIGSVDHRWRTGYFQYIDFERSTTTASFYMQKDPNTTASELIIVRNSLTVGRITNQGYIDIGGMDRSANAGLGEFARPDFGIVFQTTSSDSTVYNLSGSTVTIQTTGRPVFFCLSGQISIQQTIQNTLTVGAATAQIDVVTATGTSWRTIQFGHGSCSKNTLSGSFPSVLIPAGGVSGFLFLHPGSHTLQLTAVISPGAQLTFGVGGGFYCYEL